MRLIMNVVKITENQNKSNFHKKWLTGLVLIIYFLCVVLLHKRVGVIITDLFANFSRTTYQYAMIIAAIAVFATYLFWLLNKTNILHSKHLIAFFVSLIALTIISYPLLIIHNIEAIHFPQYAILAFLLFLLLRNYYKVVFWGLILAFIDESYQYFYIDPTNYFDFNDIVLDLFGLVYGLLPVSAGVLKNNSLIKNRFSLFIPELVFLLIIIIGFLLLNFNNILSVYPDKESLLSLTRKIDDSFWTMIKHLNVKYHIIKPLEGMIIIISLYFVFCYMLNYSDENRTKDKKVGH